MTIEGSELRRTGALIKVRDSHPALTCRAAIFRCFGAEDVPTRSLPGLRALTHDRFAICRVRFKAGAQRCHLSVDASRPQHVSFCSAGIPAREKSQADKNAALHKSGVTWRTGMSALHNRATRIL